MWHNDEKKRLQNAELESLVLLRELDTKNLAITELALALLYLGEGTKQKMKRGWVVPIRLFSNFLSPASGKYTKCLKIK